MGLPEKTTEERVSILETSEQDCKDKQDERYENLKDMIVKGDKEIMAQVEWLKNKLFGALGIGIVLILTVLANIAIALLKN